jgi:hypothetical protein
MEVVKGIDLILQYILDCEHQDFIENPSNIHIYYIALKVIYGKNEADIMLNEALKDVK